MVEVTIVRVYLTETEKYLKQLLTYLHDESQVRGVTVIRGIVGFGQSGKIHTAHLVDLSINLPVIIEFFDRPEKIEKIITHLNGFIKPGHLVYWSAHTNG
jgi:hypothetical protein